MGHIVLNKEEWFQKELEDASPANEAEGQDTTSASRTKLLENRPDSKTSTARESSTDVCRPSDFLLLASRGMVSKKCLGNEV